MRFVVCALLVCACTGPKTPEEAQAAVRAAAERGDTNAIYDLVDKSTRGSIDATFRYHQQSLATIEESYPLEAQGREKTRFVDGEDARTFFAAHEARYRLIRAAAAKAGRADFVAERGRWRWSGLRATWEDNKLRASHDLETVRESAAAYKRASR